jgi:biopolymer transport protein ExbB
MDSFLTACRSFWAQALELWVNGGWCMPPIAALGFLMFALGTHMALQLRETGFAVLPEDRWRRWIKVPEAREGRIGELLDFVMGGNSLAHLTTAFEEVRATELAPFRRELRLMKVCIAAAPLLGLLGTVTGMLSTFQALATGSGGDETMAMVSRGISAALITTETGLVVALPGVFFQFLLARKFERYQVFLAHLETVCAQRLYKKLRRKAS